MRSPHFSLLVRTLFTLRPGPTVRSGGKVPTANLLSESRRAELDYRQVAVVQDQELNGSGRAGGGSSLLVCSSLEERALACEPVRDGPEGVSRRCVCDSG